MKLMWLAQWLKTDLGSDYADLPVEVGAKATLKKILGAGKKQNGKFLNIYIEGWEERGHSGKDAPW